MAIDITSQFDAIGEAFGGLTPVHKKTRAQVLDPTEFDEVFGSVDGGTEVIGNQLQHRQNQKAKIGQPNVSLTKDEETGEDIETMPVPGALASEMEADVKPSVQKKAGVTLGPSKYTMDSIEKAGEIGVADRFMAFFSGLQGKPIMAGKIADARKARVMNLYNQEQAARNKKLQEQAIRERQNPNSEYNQNFRNVARGLYGQLGLPITVSETMTAEDMPFLKEAFEKSMSLKAMDAKDKQWYEHKKADDARALSKRDLDMKDFLAKERFKTDERIRQDEATGAAKLARAAARGGTSLGRAARFAETGEVPRSFRAGSGQTAESGAEATADLLMFQADQVGIEGANRDRLQNMSSRMAALEAGGQMNSSEYKSYARAAKKIISEAGKEIDEAAEQAVIGYKRAPNAPKLTKAESKEVRDADIGYNNAVSGMEKIAKNLDKLGTGSKILEGALNWAQIPAQEAQPLQEARAAAELLIPEMTVLFKSGVLNESEFVRYKKMLNVGDNPRDIVNAGGRIKSLIKELKRKKQVFMKGKGMIPDKTNSGGAAAQNRRAGTADKAKKGSDGPGTAVFELPSGKRVEVDVKDKESAERAFKVAKKKFGEGVSWKQFNRKK